MRTEPSVLLVVAVVVDLFDRKCSDEQSPFVLPVSHQLWRDEQEEDKEYPTAHIDGETVFRFSEAATVVWVWCLFHCFCG